MNAPLYIVDGARTPFCKMGTDLASSDAVELGRTAASAVLARTGLDPALIDEVIENRPASLMPDGIVGGLDVPSLGGGGGGGGRGSDVEEPSAV